jgi:hypothetical protein
VTVAEFKARFPELQEAPEPLVENALDEAAELCPESVWSDFTDNGIAYTAARILALSVYAKDLELTTDSGGTIYDERLMMYKRLVAVGPRVI